MDWFKEAIPGNPGTPKYWKKCWWRFSLENQAIELSSNRWGDHGKFPGNFPDDDPLESVGSAIADECAKNWPFDIA